MVREVIYYLTLVGEVALLVLAIRLYRVKRTPTYALLVSACICFIIARTSSFTVGFVYGFLNPHISRAARAKAYLWHDYTELTFELLFVALMVVVLLSSLREPKDR